MRKAIPLEIEGCSECEKLESEAAFYKEQMERLREALSFLLKNEDYPPVVKYVNEHLQAHTTAIQEREKAK